ncbi:hypothetical protein ACFXAF_35900 [Kitasatospora sp. NPDC059463]|uniref:hypothetical protein n=1 Tax=unclassified Kitasatospora TaxID=2633591 RepID=UPI0036A7CA49
MELETAQDTDTRHPNGPGVVGLAGASGAPGQREADHVGVFGRGGDEMAQSVPVGPGGAGTVVVGSPFPGAGVVGRGGGRLTQTGTAPATDLVGGGPGVVGVSGGSRQLLAGEVRDVGVVGLSTVPGSGRGGVFSTSDSPQMRLVPVQVPFSSRGTPAVTGLPGDLLFAFRFESDRPDVPIYSFWVCMGGLLWSPLA